VPRSFDLSTPSASSVEQLHRAFADEQYWRSRVAATDNGVLESMSIDRDGTIRVHATFRLLREVLPKVVTQWRRGDLHMVHRETWSPVDGGRMRGEVDVELAGAPMSTRGAGLVTPSADGSEFNYTATVAVKVPLIGGTIEGLIGSQLTSWIREVLNFTTDWISARD
jgi:hypothetical protein